MRTPNIFFFLLIVFQIVWVPALYSQVSINNDGSSADPSAMLELKSDNQGLLLPRIDYNNRPASPVAGLLIYVTANAPFGNGLYIYDGSGWLKVSTVNYYPGIQAEGGNVFYLDGTGKHGMAAASMDQGHWQWGCVSTLIGAGAQHFAFGEGDLNTAAIVAACSPPDTSAAVICDTLTLNGYTNWYLPSADEMDSLWLHQDLVGSLVPGEWYWTSTEWDAGGAVFVSNVPNFTLTWICDKSCNFVNVRCIRKF